MNRFDKTLYNLPRPAKILIFCFLTTLSFGFYIGLVFVDENTGATLNGLKEHYLGNETDQDAEIMKFKKSKKEIISLVHTHVLSMSIIFFLTGGLLLFTNLPPIIKGILIVEPFISIVVTFGGIWLLWSGYFWFKYIIIISGILMVTVFTINILVLFIHLIKQIDFH